MAYLNPDDLNLALQHFMQPPNAGDALVMAAAHHKPAGNSVTGDIGSSIKGLRNKEIFSDLTITCKGTEFKVHKIILYAQSKYFRGLLGGNFKEGKLSIVDFPDDDATVLGALIHYLYNFDLVVPDFVTDTAPAFLVDVYATADKYEVQPLCAQVVKYFEGLNLFDGNIDFFAAVRVVHENSVNDALWNVLIPKVSAKLDELLELESFEELLVEVPKLALKLVKQLSSKGMRDQARVGYIRARGMGYEGYWGAHPNDPGRYQFFP